VLFQNDVHPPGGCSPDRGLLLPEALLSEWRQRTGQPNVCRRFAARGPPLSVQVPHPQREWHQRGLRGPPAHRHLANTAGRVSARDLQTPLHRSFAGTVSRARTTPTSSWSASAMNRTTKTTPFTWSTP
jgi:hypothetical protein